MQKKLLETPCMFVLCSCSSLQKRTREALESNKVVLAAMNQHKRKRGKKNIDFSFSGATHGDRENES